MEVLPDRARSVGPRSNHDRYDGLMSRVLTATEVKATILALLDDVAAGDEVEITKHGRVVAQLVPAPRSAPDPRGRSLVPRGAQRATTNSSPPERPER